MPRVSGETGLDYFGARYFSAAQGRFTSPDPVAGSIFNPQSLNLYAYAWNNPLRFTDPTGMVVSWEDSGEECQKGETRCRTALQRSYEDRLRGMLFSKDAKTVAKGAKLLATYTKLEEANEVFHVVKEGGTGSGELGYRGEPGNLYIEMKGSGSMYGEMPDVQKLAHEFQHGEQFLGGLLGFTNITGKWTGYRDDLVDEANAFMAGFIAEPVGRDQSKFLQGLAQAAQWGVQAVVNKLDSPGSPYAGRPTQQMPISTIPPSVYAVPRSK
jgi:RHS repeat-associated protein